MGGGYQVTHTICEIVSKSVNNFKNDFKNSLKAKTQQLAAEDSNEGIVFGS